MNENKVHFSIVLLVCVFMITSTLTTLNRPNQTQKVEQKVNVNQANNVIDIESSSKDNLSRHPEITDDQAAKIVHYIQNNSINSIRELKKVDGVGDRELELIQRHIKVGAR